MGFGKWILGGVCAVGAVIAAPIVLPMAAAGAASGAVGLASVATVAGTTAGATAVGTIATAGVVGITTTGIGAKKMLEAKEIVEKSEKKYKNKKAILDKEEIQTNESLNNLGVLKLQVWKGFDEFYDVITKIKNCNIIDVNAKDETLRISKEELDNLKAISFKASELLSASAGSLGAGALAGVVAYGGTMVVGTASTGTAIAGLSGAAATNATLAAIGGDSIATGGLGIAGGTAVLGGLVAVPALAIGGIFIIFKGNSSIEKALEVEEKADAAVKQMTASIKLVKIIGSTVDTVSVELAQLNKNFKVKLNELGYIVSKKQDFRSFTMEEIKITETCILTFKIIKKLTTTDLIIKKGDQQTVNNNGITPIIDEAKHINSQLN